MLARTHTLGLVLLSLLVGALLHPAPAQAAPPLPRQTGSDEVFMFMFLDVEKVDVPSLQAAAKAVLGEHAGIVDQPLAMGGALRQQFVKAGGRSLVFLAPMDPGRNRPSELVLVGLRDGANADDLKKAIAEMQGAQPNTQAADADKGWLRLESMGRTLRPLPAVQEGAGGEHQKFVQAALAEAGDRPAGLVFVPTEAFRQSVSKELARDQQLPPGMPDFPGITKALLPAQWLVAAAQPGADPSLKVVAQMPDAASAKALADKYKEFSASLADFMKSPMGGMGARSFVGMLLLTMNGGPAPEVKDNRVTLTLSGETLKKLGAQLGATLGGAQAQAKSVQAMSQMRQLGVAVQIYANENNGALPDNLDQLKKYLGDGKEESVARILTNARTGDKPGFIYTKPAGKLSDVQNPAQTAILHESKGGKADPEGCVGYLDGHVEGPKKAAP